MDKIYSKAAKVLKAKIEEFDYIVIFRHQSPDYDAFGSQLGLQSFIKDNYPNKICKVVGHNHDVFTGKLYPQMDVVSDEELFAQDFLAIICDTGDTKRIDDERYAKAAYKIKFDHHPPVELYGDKNFIVDELSSCGELVTHVITSRVFKGTVISKKTAKYLFSAIVGDSGRFYFPSTSPSTFKAASELLKTGLDMQKEVYQPMYLKHVQDLEVTKYLLNNYGLSKHQTVAYYFMDSETQKRFNINTDRGKENLSFFSSFEEIKIWVSFTDDEEKGNIRVSIRSREIPINGIASKYRGGGHKNASGARVNSKDEAMQLIEDLDNLTI